MDLSRAGGLLTLTVAATLVVCSCRDRAPSGMPRTSPPAPPAGSVAPRPPLTAGELAAYARGREREVELMRTALERLRRAGADSAARAAAVLMVADRVEGEGAMAAGLETERYHALVARMDSVLRARSREAVEVGGAVAVRASRDVGSVEEWRRLDSLRVELAVLRSRFEAAAVAEGVAR
jgi:hypothetical protein